MDNNNSNNPFYSKYEQSKPPSAKKAFGRPVEIPLPKKIKLSDIILIAAFAVIFFMGIFVRLDESFPSVFELIAFLLVAIAVISAPFIDRYMLKKVCTRYALSPRQAHLLNMQAVNVTENSAVTLCMPPNIKYLSTVITRYEPSMISLKHLTLRHQWSFLQIPTVMK